MNVINECVAVPYFSANISPMRALKTLNRSSIIFVFFSLIVFGGCTKPQISGKVVEQTSKGEEPLTGVTITVDGTQLKTATDSRGEYNIGYIPGRFVLTFSKPDFTIQHVSYDLAQVNHVPAAPVAMIPKPNDSEWTGILKSSLSNMKRKDDIDRLFTLSG